MNLTKRLQQNRLEKKALLATNFYNYETLRAIINAAHETNSSIILQVSESSLKYMGVKTAAAMAKSMLEELGVEGWLHFDHGASIALVQSCLDAGFDSVMIDASEQSFEDNIKTTSQVVKIAEQYHANVEAELGYVAKLGQEQSFLCTDPNQAKTFVEATGIHCLAVAIGNAHGFYKAKPQLHFDVLATINDLCQLPLVLHGSSGIPNEDLQTAIAHGICKINLATEIKNCFMKAIKNAMSNNDEIDLRIVFPPAINATKDLVAAKLNAING